MAFCKNCGVQLNDNATFCSNCGATVANAPAQNNAQPMQQPMNQQMYQQQMYQQPVMQAAPKDPTQGFMPDFTADFDAADISKTKVLNLFSYIGMLFLIPVFLFKGKSKFARFHINQGLVLFLLSCVFDGFTRFVGFMFDMLGRFVDYDFYYFGNIVTLIFSILLGSVIVAYMVIGIINTTTGKARELPLLGKIHIVD